MTSGRNVLLLLEEGHALLERERKVILSGRFDEISAIADEKQAYLEALDGMLVNSAPTSELRGALAALADAGRRNERLIAGALMGFRGARRKIEAIMATRRGAVAYAADGSPISSWADALRESRRA